uniref:Uncharacterized protein n=1 Tax=Angiostrongylus cantonensis TaxID=6313 RepID=A0A0K0DLL4_ANGCA
MPGAHPTALLMNSVDKFFKKRYKSCKLKEQSERTSFEFTQFIDRSQNCKRTAPADDAGTCKRVATRSTPPTGPTPTNHNHGQNGF